MIFSEIWSRFKLLCTLTFAYMIISLINGLLVRVAIKCSVLTVFPVIYFQNLILRGNRRRQINNIRSIYQSMGNTGALAAYLDRHDRSKSPLIICIMTSLTIYYLMYMASYDLWTGMTFNNTYSGIINDQYYFYVNYTELLAFLFIRTRSSIKYLSKLVTIINLMFLMYVNQ